MQKPKGRPRIDPATRRDNIVAAAYEAFIQLGFAACTTEIVAARARVSKRTIYEQFPGKIEMFGAVVEKHHRLIVDLPRPPDEDLAPLDALRLIFRLDMDGQQDREREALLNLIVREATLVPELSAFLYDRDIIRFREDLTAWLQLQAERRRLMVEDPALCAGLFMDVVFGALLPRRQQAGDGARNDRKRDIVKRLAVVLKGLGN